MEPISCSAYAVKTYLCNFHFQKLKFDCFLALNEVVTCILTGHPYLPRFMLKGTTFMERNVRCHYVILAGIGLCWGSLDHIILSSTIIRSHTTQHNTCIPSSSPQQTIVYSALCVRIWQNCGFESCQKIYSKLQKWKKPQAPSIRWGQFKL